LLSVEPAPDAIADSDTGISSSDDAIYYNGLFRVENPDHRLRIAMTAKVTIVLNEAKDALTIPSSLLGDKGPDGNYVVRVYDPTAKAAKPTRITIGLNNNITAEVTSGLKEGDLVISGGTRRVTGAGSSEGRRRGPRIMGL
jgi:macrolide-specific efflux system membrane fusion protein